MLNPHRLMVGDSIRVTAFQKAIHEVVKPGHIVVDLGAGTGLLAFFACQAGAARVYAIEKDDIIEAAREVAVANGLQDRVIFIEDDAEAVTLPEPVDVVVGELIGVMAFEENLLRLYDIACRRYLKPDGCIVPQSISIFFAPWEAPTFYEEVDLWKKELYGLTFSPLRSLAMNQYYTTLLNSTGILAPPQPFWHLSLPIPQQEPMISATSFEIQRAGLLHGFAGWFEARLSSTVTLSSSPFTPPTHWQHAFFPLETPLAVQPGDLASLTVSATGGIDGVLWGWEGRVVRGEQAVGTFSAHTFRGIPLSPITIRTGSREVLPDRSEEGEIMLEILSGMDGETSPAMLAEKLSIRHPHRFGSQEAALHHILLIARRWRRKHGS